MECLVPISMRLAIIGAAGHCGRQLAVQLLDRHLIPSEGLLQLVGHRGGGSEVSLWSLRADLSDAFCDNAPSIDVVLDPEEIRADLVVMLAGRTLSTNPGENADRARLGRDNLGLFQRYADVLAGQPGEPPVVIVQSNPVELGVRIFAEALGRHRVIGAGAWSDTLRFRTELARDLSIRRTHLQAWALGQHGDHLIPCRSQINAWGITATRLRDLQNQLKQAGRATDYGERLRQQRGELLQHLQNQAWSDANALISSSPADLRTGLRPFLTHFTSAGHTTEVMTAHAVADLVACLAEARTQVVAAQVLLDGEWPGCREVLGVPVLLGSNGWTQVCPLELDADEHEAMHQAAEAISTAIATVREA